MWLLVCCLYKDIYLQFFKCVSFWLHGCCWEWEGGPVNRLTSWVAVFTLTDRPKSVCNCCLIELFVCVVTLLFWHFCWCTCRGFCHKTKSDLLFVMITPLTISTCTCIWLNLIYIRSSPFGFQLNDVDAGGATVFPNLNARIPVVKVYDVILLQQNFLWIWTSEIFRYLYKTKDMTYKSFTVSFIWLNKNTDFYTVSVHIKYMDRYLCIIYIYFLNREYLFKVSIMSTPQYILFH